MTNIAEQIQVVQKNGYQLLSFKHNGTIPAGSNLKTYELRCDGGDSVYLNAPSAEEAEQLHNAAIALNNEFYGTDKMYYIRELTQHESDHFWMRD